MINAIVIEESSGGKIFTPTGVTGEWELKLVGMRGEEPGGHWSSMEVAEAVVEAVYEGASGA